MTMWEYKIKYVTNLVDDVPAEEQLNIFGQDGWELVTVLEGMGWTFFFKRPIIYYVGDFKPSGNSQMLEEKTDLDKSPNLIHREAEEYPEDMGNDGG